MPDEQSTQALLSGLYYATQPVVWAQTVCGISPDEWQQAVLDSTRPRLMLNCCRQSGKSTITSVVALHRAMFHPNSLILLISPSLRQSGELFKKIKYFVGKALPTLTEDNKLSLMLSNGSRIVSLPSGEDTIRGFSGVNLLIVDEASRVPDELYKAVRPMLAVSQGRLIVLSTPFGCRGFFYEEWIRPGSLWQKIHITAHNCMRIPAEFLEEERAVMGDAWYRSEYLGEFIDNASHLFGRDLIESALVDDNGVKVLDFNDIVGDIYKSAVRDSVTVLEI